MTPSKPESQHLSFKGVPIDGTLKVKHILML